MHSIVGAGHNTVRHATCQSLLFNPMKLSQSLVRNIVRGPQITIMLIFNLFSTFFFTMITRRKTAKLPPRALLEVTNVLTGPTAGPFIFSMSKLKYRLLKKDDQEGDEKANKDWGVTVVDEGGMPASFKTTMMETVLAVDKVKLLATELRDENFFHRIFINRMCTTDDAEQQRQDDSPQHLWHLDGNGAPAGEQLLTVVCTLYDDELDSEALSAMDVGGRLGLSNADDGHFTPVSSTSYNKPKSHTTTTCYPKTNSLYIFPGYFVAHAVYKVHPGTVRYSIVMFVRLRTTLINGVTPDTHLRAEWAASNPENKSFVCRKCWSAFHTQPALMSHQNRSCKKQSN
jgi:hypothetical protein